MGKDVTIIGREWPIKLPPQFAVAEELVMAYAEAGESSGQRLRACAAVIGICTGLGVEAKADYVKAGFRPLAYGGAVYGYLREKGAKPVDVIHAALPLLALLSERVFPRESEVAEQASFSGPAAVG